MGSDSFLPDSEYIKAADVEDGDLILTIVAMTKVKKYQSEEETWQLLFDNDQKLTLNNTNRVLLAKAIGTDQPTEAIGKKVALYHDPSVRNPSGQVVGGVRIKKVGGKVAAKVAAKSGDDADDVGF